MDNGALEVVAAAAGVIVFKEDGNADRSCGLTDETARANAIAVRHEDGTTGIYLHFKTGSLTAREVGDSVQVNEFLGLVGSSGFSGNPHLHFELVDTEDNVIDPFLGECNYTTDRSWWKDQPDSFEPKVNALLTHSTAPDPFQCYGQTIYNVKLNYTYGDTFYLASYHRDELEGQKSVYRIRRPDNSIWLQEEERISPDTFATSYWWFRYFLPTSDESNEGKWTVEIDFNGQT